MSLTAINPYNNKKIKSYKELTLTEIDVKVAIAEKAFHSWKLTGFPERAKLMQKLAVELKRQEKELAELMALEMGKPFKQGMAEVEKCVWVCEYYAKNAQNFLKAEPVKTEASKSYVTFEPLGVILAVMPWNFPLWQVFRFAVPSIMAGNTGLLKHASNVPGCAEAIESLFEKAGFPEGVFQNLPIPSTKVDKVIENKRVKAVTLTGSTAAGKAVAAKAGSLLKKTVLELGGSDPYVILEDADLAAAALACVNSRLINNGQSCIAAKRFIVVKSVEKEFIKLFKEIMEQKTMGNPMVENVDIGPQARVDLRDELHQQVIESIKTGAKCILGGELPKGDNAFYPPTILIDVKPGMPAYSEELFGPVAAIISAKDEQDAIRIANDTTFGLGAAVFTKNKSRGEQIAAHQLEAGACFVNAFVRSDPRLPFGGIKESGYGRELGHYGIKEFVNTKTVYVG